MSTFPGLDLYPGEDLYPSGIGGGIFTRGAGATALWLGEEPVLAAYLGDLLIWDGTVSAFVSAPIATATAQSASPAVQSQPPDIEAPIAAATAAGIVPALAVSSSIAAPLAAATAAASAPVVSADANITVPIATASAQGIPPLSDADIAVPTATATAEAHVPTVATTGSSTIGVPTATASAEATPPSVVVAAAVAAPIATAAASAPIPAVSGGATIAVPVATATASASAPVAGVTTFAASGMTKNSTMTWASSSTWVLITSWTANTATYPGSSVTSNRLNVQGSKTNATVSASVPYTGGFFNRNHTIRLVDQSGNVIATGATITLNAGTCTVTANNVDLTAITSIGVQMNSSGSNAGTVTSGSTCNLTIT